MYIYVYVHSRKKVGEIGLLLSMGVMINQSMPACGEVSDSVQFSPSLPT